MSNSHDDFKQAALDYHRLSPPGKIRVTATILDLNREQEKATLKMADGSVATVKVQNPANLDKVKVGDTILIRYLEAVEISVKGKKR